MRIITLRPKQIGFWLFGAWFWFGDLLRIVDCFLWALWQYCLDDGPWPFLLENDCSVQTDGPGSAAPAASLTSGVVGGHLQYVTVTTTLPCATQVTEL